MAENKDEEFSDKLSDKKLRATAAKLKCESENDANALKIVLGQSQFTNTQRSWLTVLAGRRGKKFVFVESKKLGDKSPKTPAVKSGDVPLNSRAK